MKTKAIIGVVLISLPFIAGIAIGIAAVGWEMVWAVGGAISACACIIGGAYLFLKEDK
jgi:hypothetical protein